MKNFVAFRFTDNDFHSALQRAVIYIVEHRDGDLSLEAWREFAIRGMVAFTSLNRISDWGMKHPTPVHRDYFDKWLTVTEVDTLTELGSGFEGYVFDSNLMSVYYVGY